MKLYFLFGILLVVCFSALGQEKKVVVNGIITDETNIAIPEVFISINWSKSGLLSKDDGSFYLIVSEQDTLVFRHTSFEPKAIALQNSNTDTLKVQLTERTLILDEVEVTNWGDWKDFKRKIANQNSDSIRQTPEYQLKTMFNNIDLFPEDKHADRFLSSLKIPSLIAKQLNPYGASFVSMGIGLNKQRENPYITKEKKIKLALEKNAYRYSLSILSKIVKLEGTALKEFKNYCDYFIDFKQNDYQLTKQIHTIYKEWEEQTLSADSLKKKKLNYLPVSKTPFNSSTPDRNK